MLTAKTLKPIDRKHKTESTVALIISIIVILLYLLVLFYLFLFIKNSNFVSKLRNEASVGAVTECGLLPCFTEWYKGQKYSDPDFIR